MVADPPGVLVGRCLPENPGRTKSGLGTVGRKNAAAHKRLIINATAGITRAALVRWHVPILFQHQHAANTATYVFLVLLAVYDLWSTHKIHRATIWGSVFLILMGQIGRFIGPTAPWHAFAHWMQNLGV